MLCINGNVTPRVHLRTINQTVKVPVSALMNRWKMAIVVAVLMAVTVVGGSALYVRSQVKTALEDTITAVSPFAGARYASMSVTLGGNIHIHDVEINPRMVNESLRIEGIDIETPGLWFLLTGTKKLREGKIPEHLRIQLRGLVLNIGGPITESLDQLIALAAQANGSASMSNCGDVRYFDLKAYRRLGYQTLVFDIASGYDFEKRGGPMHVKTEWRLRDVGAATMDLEFAGLSSTLNDSIATRARLRTFTFRYQDLSFADRQKRYCAEASGMTPAQYIDAEVNRSDNAYQMLWGFIPGPGLRAAYREFLTRPGEIQLQGTPAADVDLQALRLFKPDDVVSMLNLRVSVNGNAVTDLSMTVIPKQSSDDKAAATTGVSAAAAPVTAKPLTPPVTTRSIPASPTTAGERHFRAVAVKDLGQYINKTVRLTLRRGAVREGQLLQIASGMARVERRYEGGSAIIAIPLPEIQRAEVFL